MNKVVPFSFYFLFFGGVASFQPYLVLFYQSLDFTGAQIGFLVGLAPLITIFTMPIITGIADTRNRHRLVMSFALMSVVLMLIVLPFLTSFVTVFIVVTLAIVLFAPIVPLAASATMYMLGERKDLFGRLRLGGTFGFGIAATIVGSVVQANGLKFAFWSAAALFFAGFILSLGLIHGDNVTRKSTDWRKAAELLKNPHFVIFLLIGLTCGITFVTINTYLFPYMKTLGADETVMGLALTFGTLAEVPVLFFVNNFIKRFKAEAVLLFAMAMTGLRFVLLALAPTATIVLLVQLLNGFNYPLLMVAGVTYADEHAPDGFRATSQGLFNVAVGGLGSAIGGFIGGLLVDSIGAEGMYLAFGLFVLVVLVGVLFARSVLPPEQQVIPATES